MTTDGLFIEDGTDDVGARLKGHIDISVVLECCAGTVRKEIPGCTLGQFSLPFIRAGMESRGELGLPLVSVSPSNKWGTCQ